MPKSENALVNRAPPTLNYGVRMRDASRWSAFATVILCVGMLSCEGGAPPPPPAQQVSLACAGITNVKVIPLPGRIAFLAPTDIAREAKIALHSPAVERVRNELALEDSDDALLSRLRVLPKDDSTLVFQFAADQPGIARDASAAFAKSYVTERKLRLTQAVRQQARGLAWEMRSLWQHRRINLRQMQDLPPGSRERRIYRGELGGLAARRIELRKNLSFVNAFVPDGGRIKRTVLGPGC